MDPIHLAVDSAVDPISAAECVRQWISAVDLFFRRWILISADESAAGCNRRWIALFGGGFGDGSATSVVDSAVDFAFGGGLRNLLLKRAVDGPLGRLLAQPPGIPGEPADDGSAGG